jgi:hypothetical protein
MAEGFYVSVMKKDLVDKPSFARGPFPTLEEAASAVEETRKLAETRDPWSVFYRWGVTKLAAGVLPAAPMNRFWTEDGY